MKWDDVRFGDRSICVGPGSVSFEVELHREVCDRRSRPAKMPR